MATAQSETGIRIPYPVLGMLLSLALFIVTFIGSVRVIERWIEELDLKTTKLDLKIDEANVDLRDHAVKLGMMEAAMSQGCIESLSKRGPK